MIDSVDIRRIEELNRETREINRKTREINRNTMLKVRIALVLSLFALAVNAWNLWRIFS